MNLKPITEHPLFTFAARIHSLSCNFMVTLSPSRYRQIGFLSNKWDSNCCMFHVQMWISVTGTHSFLYLYTFAVIQFEMVHWPWNEIRPRTAFLPRLFSAIHSYAPASSCWKLGISRTAFAFFILTLLGKGTPLVLLQLISGTGLQKRNKKFPWWQLSVAVIKVWLSTEEK